MSSEKNTNGKTAVLGQTGLPETFALRRFVGKILPESFKDPIRYLFRAQRARAYRNYPRILLTSVPKAGTHLIRSLIDELGFRAYLNQGFNPNVQIEFDPKGMRPLLRRLMPAEYLIEHLVWHKEIESQLVEHKVKTIFIYRDPRATAISFAHYVAEMYAPHRLHNHYASLKDLDERVIATLEGIPDEKSSNGFGRAPLSVLYDKFLPWRDSPLVYTASFEELVGPKGGGSAEKQIAAVQRLLTYLGLEDSQEVVDRVSEKVFNVKTVTFRSGQIDKWRKEIRPETAEFMDQNLKKQLAEWGYS